MKRYRLKQVYINAKQWFRVGDIKGIVSYKEADKCYDSVGSVDEYYGNITTKKKYDEEICRTCNKPYGEHGLMITKEAGSVRVCLGEWITHWQDGLHDPLSEEHFEKTYELDI